MPTRDEQEYEQRRQQIIDGALEVFSQKGFEKATNKDIAQAAGIGSPGLIYHYFKDKQDLFRRMVEHRIPILQLIHRPEALMELPPREGLVQIANAIMATFSTPMAIAMFRLLWGEIARRPEIAEFIANIGPIPGLAFMSRYLSHHMELGNLRRMNPEIAARAFIGPFAAYLFTRELFRMQETLNIDPQEMARSSVEIFLRGMEPEDRSNK